MNSEKEYLKEEIRKEFQLERMVLFSDAVFAIAITLMAIEIKAPEAIGINSQEAFLQHLGPVLPAIFAYIVSFIFVGYTWYQHLQLFSLLKDYNKGVVLRNLIMLFFIGLFPFGASIIAKGYTNTWLQMYIYMGIVLLCSAARHVLQHYIIIKHPELCIRTNLTEQKIELAKSRVSFIIFGIIIVLVLATQLLISNPALKPMAVLWFAVFPVFFKIFQKKGKKHQHAGK